MVNTASLQPVGGMSAADGSIGNEEADCAQAAYCDAESG